MYLWWSLHTSNILTSQVNYSRQLGYLCCCLWDIFQALITPPPPPPPRTFIISTASSFHRFSRPWEKGAFSHPHPLPPPSGLSSSHTPVFYMCAGEGLEDEADAENSELEISSSDEEEEEEPMDQWLQCPCPPPPPQPLDMAQQKLQASALHATVTRRGTTACDRKGEKVVSALCITATVETRTRIASAVLVHVWNCVCETSEDYCTLKKKREKKRDLIEGVMYACVL